MPLQADASTSYFPQVSEESSAVERRIESYSQLSPGWYFGEGSSFRREVVEIALALTRHALKIGLLSQESFPGVSGEIRVSIYVADCTLELTVEADGSITLCEEENDVETCYEEGLTLEEAQGKIKEFARHAWRQYVSSISSIITVGIRRDLIASPFEAPVMAQESPSLIENVSIQLAEQSVNIFESIIRRLVASPQSSGSSTPESYLQAVS